MRTPASFSLAALVATLLLGTSAALGQASKTDNQVPIHGTVASVDSEHFMVDLRYASPGSEPVTRHTFLLTNHDDVLRLHPGAVVDASADMTQKVWTLSNVNVESDKPLKGQVGP